MLLVGLGSLAVGMLTPTSKTGVKAPVKTVDFNRDIRPILGKCSACHGPASGEGAAGLRLDEFSTATATLGDGKRAIAPGNPEGSELLKRVNAKDATQMPPADSHKVLSAEEKALLKTWIAEGAEFKKHWAFVKPVRPEIPAVKNAKWARNDIDRFILADLEKNGLAPESEATKETLIRRVTLDLTGLPPTPAEVKAFVADTSKGAYEEVVDRLLKSPRYGERMAMDWMDYSRYADSNGYQADFERFQSRWRDWVIDAFNKNEPYDQFTVDQIAGDLLPNPTTDQKLATAFNRNHRINTEGGVIVEEWRIETVIDRVETTTAVWLGLTAGCARCHDHKYDPITQKDFYSLCGYFNNVPESGSGEERPINHPPTMKAPTAAQTAEMTLLSGKEKQLDSWLDARLESHKIEAAAWQLDKPLPAVSDGLVTRAKFGPETKLEGNAKLESGRATGAVATGEMGFVDLGNIGDFDRKQSFSYGAWIRSDNGNGAPFAKMDVNNGFRGWEFSLNNGRPQAHIINTWPMNALKIYAKDLVPNKKWMHVLITYDGSSKASGMKMYIDGKAVPTMVEADSLSATIRTTVSAKIGRRTSTETFAGAVDDFVLYNRVLKPDEVATLASTSPAYALLSVPMAQRTSDQIREIAKLWSLEHDAEFRKNYELDAFTKAKREQIDASIPAVMVMQEMAKPRDCFVLIRGQYDKHGDKVTMNVPAFLPKLPAGVPNNRLGLAKWIVSPDNPLTARVTVNRLWERFFGTGIVATSEDFGTRADFPTNPELLDYLATEFVRLKWDLKATMKEMVMSASYRQSSHVSEAKLQKDPLNKLISRGPRFRLPGEVIRDSALFCSGLLVERLGGPSVRPYMPPGIWDETNVYGNLRNYKHDMGDGLYRRSLYTIWKRTAAPPNMLLFDVPSREACRVRRARTDTPLQALTLMNDETYVEASRVLGQKMIREGGPSVESRLTYGFWRVLGRAPRPDELKLMSSAVRKRLVRFGADTEAAKVLIAVGEAPLDKTLKPAELATYMLAASTMMNLDEAITKE